MCSKRSPLAPSIGDVTWRPATSSLLDRSYVKEFGGPDEGVGLAYTLAPLMRGPL